MTVLKNIFRGLYLLFQDPAGALCLISLCIVSFLCYRGKVGDIAFAATCTLLSGLAVIMKHKSFSGSDLDQGTQTTTVQGGDGIIGEVVKNVKAE
jgi:hypothetical protein